MRTMGSEAAALEPWKRALLEAAKKSVGVLRMVQMRDASVATLIP